MEHKHQCMTVDSHVAGVCLSSEFLPTKFVHTESIIMDIMDISKFQLFLQTVGEFTDNWQPILQCISSTLYIRFNYVCMLT